ncbi:uncharacterized protein [Ptychodera flava]|uniref:uncharacterized protein isoform X2 n=1 Tax=Ptychodera flava TaxID=63121 RepID=UPI003969E0B3
MTRGVTIWIGLHELTENTPPYWVDGRKIGEHKPNKRYPWKSEDGSSEENDCVLAVPSANREKLLWQYADCEATQRYLCAFSDLADEHAKEKIQEELDAIETEKEMENHRPFAMIEKANKTIGENLLLEGDIAFDPDFNEISESGESETRRRRGAAWQEDRLWPEGKVYYELDSWIYFLSDQKRIIFQAMDEIEAKTCIRFIPRSDEENYVLITKYGGCWSHLGLLSDGAQYLSLDDECFESVGTPIHEFLHALGFFHEQSRPDRSKFLYVNYDNIEGSNRANFKVYKEMITHGAYYDYNSVLQYHRFAFAKDHTVPTLTLKKKFHGELGQRNGMSMLDAYEVNRLYKCNYTVDGGWAPWSDWTECPVTCGGGVQVRKRTCDFPPPTIDPPGMPCEGDEKEKRTCMDIKCPTDMDYSWLGCYWDIGESELLTTLEDTGNPHLLGSYWERIDAVHQCAAAALSVNHDIFALRFGGKCYSMSTQESDTLYEDGGVSDECFSGTGTTDSIDVYSLTVVVDSGTSTSGPHPTEAETSTISEEPAQWDEWEEWGSCVVTESAQCLGDRQRGQQVRSRVCLGPSPTSCIGENVEHRDCYVECSSPDPWLCVGQDLFIFILEPSLNWNASREYCKGLDIERGSDLPILQDKAMRDTVREHIINSDILARPVRHSYWIGCSDAEEEGTFTWVDGKTVDMATAGWENNEPNNKLTKCPDTGEDCCRLWERSGRGTPRYNLDDDCCDLDRHFICEIRGYCPAS